MLETGQYLVEVGHFAKAQKRCSFFIVSHMTRRQELFKLPFDEFYRKKFNFKIFSITMY